ncbi:MAG: penicillin-binding transpeptidase domain-containing protein [Paludibacteraceae bacterium]|jgi:penicillin-binding protein 2|nr:penicillin-binding protein 2 [Paludibacteraceae bacterium]MEE0912322.1 penicillin-binding transpeptidase domain-containing protein [Paludibacteraceae bacterium]
MINDLYGNRKYVIGGLMVLVVLIYILRLFSLQILDDSYQDKADSNAYLKQIEFPARGLIKDRNGKILVFNKPSYDVMMVVREMKQFDTLGFCTLLNISQEEFDIRMKDLKKRVGYSSYTPQQFMTQLPPEDYGVLQEQLFRFPGVYMQMRTIRNYNYSAAALLLGSVGEVNRKMIEKDEFYVLGDYAGQNGVEQTYENVLRGKKGVEVFLRDAHGRIQGKLDDGAHDVQSKAGQNLTLSIDIDLQMYGERLMENKVGSIVAIDPKTGEILAQVSSPTYDPAILSGRKRSENYEKLLKNPLKPLLDRPVMAYYPPGSTFKIANALIFEQEGIISENTYQSCHLGYHVGRFSVGCHAHYSPLNLVQSVQHSCNAYYCASFRTMMDHKKYKNISDAFETWKNHIVSLGFGYKLGADVPNEKRGYIPNSGVYDKLYGKDRWKSLMIVSNSIGQGEILTTPLQIANLAAIVANRGYFIVPHLVKNIEGGEIDSLYLTKKITSISPQYFTPIIEGMDLVMRAGTGWYSRIDSVAVCGKTGTAENPHGEDHSLFMAFAPKDDPKIAICVVVENSGFGATWAAPIASLMIEKYLKGYIAPRRIPMEEKMLNSNLLPKDVVSSN